MFRGTARFQVLRPLGAGGMGLVYEALDRERGLHVALKTLRVVSADGVQRFKNEFRALQNLHHPNLVSLGELHEHAGQWFFTMELLEGTDLLGHVRGEAAVLADEDTLPADARPRRYDDARLRDAFDQLTCGLLVLHAAGKVHRDIKPSNVRVTPAGRVVLLDFGLVTDLAGSADPSSSSVHVVGSTMYMAPEQAAGERVGPEADWYSVGVMLYEALTGQLPFSGAPFKVLLDKNRSAPPPPRALDAEVPEDLDALCLQLLAFDPKARPSGRDVARRLGVVRPDGSPSAAGSSMTSSAYAPPFVGRARELALLEESFERTRSQGASTVVVRGASGLGKSALVHEFTQGLRTRLPQTVVLAGRCYERESVPYKAFDGVIDALSRHLRRLDPVDAAIVVGHDGALAARLFPALGRVEAIRRAAPPLQEIPDPQELRNRAFAALRLIFRRLAGQAPLVLAVDDWQWADADSRALLTELLRAPQAPPALVLVTTRPAELVGLPAEARVVELTGLPAAEAEELVALLAARFGADADAAALARETEGHPLFLQELVQHVAHSGGLGAGPARLEDALLARVGRLDEPAHRLLEVFAVAGAPISLRVAAKVAGLEHVDSARHAAILRITQLVRSSGARADDQLEPYHDRIREAVAGSVPDDRRRDLHGRLADALETDEPRLEDPQMLLRHLEAAGQADRAATQAARAAHVASEALAFEQAAELYRAALRLGRHDDAERRRVLIRLADALANSGRCAEAADVYLSAAVGADAAVRLRCQRRAAEQFLTSGHADRGLEQLRTVLAEVGLSLAPTPRRALLSLLWHRARLRLRGLAWKERDSTQITSEDQQRLEVYRVGAGGLALVDTIRAFEFQARGLRLALDTGDPVHVGRALGNEAAFQASGGQRTPRVDRLLAEGRRIADAKGDPYLEAYAQVTSGMVDYFGGRFVAALEPLGVAEAVFRDRTTGASFELGTTRIFLVFCLQKTGALRELGARLDDYLRDATRRGDRYVATTMSRGCGIVWLAADDPDRYAEELERRLWSPPETGFLHLQQWYELRASAELALYQGQAAAAEAGLAAHVQEVGASLLLRVQVLRTDYLWLRARLALAPGAASDASRRLAEAGQHARRLERERGREATALALLIRAGIAGRERARDRALKLLHAAVAAAETTERFLCAAAARRRLGQLLGGTEGATLVAAADAWMAAEGIVRPDRMTEMLMPGFD